MKIPLTYPDNASQLYDLLQEMFGLGDWDELTTSRTPWWKARLLEVGKLKRQMAKQKVTIDQLTRAAWYARRWSIPVRGVWTLVDLIPDADAEYTKVLREVEREDLERQRTWAILAARHIGEEYWEAALLRASYAELPDTLARWSDHENGLAAKDR